MSLKVLCFEDSSFHQIHLRQIFSPLGLVGLAANGKDGLDDQENLVNAFRSRCDAYLTKPIRREELMGYLKAWGLI